MDLACRRKVNTTTDLKGPATPAAPPPLPSRPAEADTPGYAEAVLPGDVVYSAVDNDAGAGADDDDEDEEEELVVAMDVYATVSPKKKRGSVPNLPRPPLPNPTDDQAEGTVRVASKGLLLDGTLLKVFCVCSRSSSNKWKFATCVTLSKYLLI